MDHSSSLSTPPRRKRTKRKRSPSNSTPRKGVKSNHKKEASQTPSQDAFAVTDIIHEKTTAGVRWFLIVWAGADESTDKPWEHTYEPETGLGDQLLQGWELKQAKIAHTKDGNPTAARRTIHWYLAESGVITQEYKTQKRTGTLENSILASESPLFVDTEIPPANPQPIEQNSWPSSSAPLSHPDSCRSPVSLPLRTSLPQGAGQKAVNSSLEEPTLISDTLSALADPAHRSSLQSPKREQDPHIVIDPPPLNFDPTEYKTVTASQLELWDSTADPVNQVSSSRIIPDSQSLRDSLKAYSTLEELASEGPVANNSIQPSLASEITVPEDPSESESEAISAQEQSPVQTTHNPSGDWYSAPEHRAFIDSDGNQSQFEASIRKRRSSSIQQSNPDLNSASDSPGNITWSESELNSPQPAPLTPNSPRLSPLHCSLTSDYERLGDSNNASDLGEFESQIPFIRSLRDSDISKNSYPILSRNILEEDLPQSESDRNTRITGSDLPNTFSTLNQATTHSLNNSSLTCLDGAQRRSSPRLSQKKSSRSLTEYSKVSRKSRSSSRRLDMEPTDNAGVESGRKRFLSQTSQQSQASPSMKRARMTDERDESDEEIVGPIVQNVSHESMEDEAQLPERSISSGIVALEERLLDVQSKLDHEKRGRSDLEKDHGHLQTRFEQQSRQNNLLQHELTKCQAALETSKNRLTKLSADLGEARNERSSLRVEIEGLRTALQESKIPELESFAEALKKADRVAQLEKRLDLVQSDLAYTQEQYKAAGAAAQASRDEAENLRTVNEDLTRRASGEARRFREIFHSTTNSELIDELELRKAQIEALERSLTVALEEKKGLLERLDREERRAGMSLNTRSSSPGPGGAVAGRSGLGQLSAALGSASSSRAASPAAVGVGRGTFKTSPLQNAVSLEEGQ